MAMHKRRNGSLAVCWQCREGRHDECANANGELVDVYVCHCHCRPACRRPACNGVPAGDRG